MFDFSHAALMLNLRNTSTGVLQLCVLLVLGRPSLVVCRFPACFSVLKRANFSHKFILYSLSQS